MPTDRKKPARLILPMVVTCLLNTLSSAVFAQTGTPATGTPAAAPAAGAPVVQETPEQKAARIAAASKRFSLELEARISELVARHIPPQEFQVIVSAEASEEVNDQLPYFPGTTGLGVAPAAGDKSQLKSVAVSVYLGKRFGKETTTSLDKILKEKLKDLAESNLTVKFEKLTVKTEPADSEIQRRLEKAEADLRSANTTTQSVERERNDFKSELLSVKSNLESQKTNFDNQIKSEQEKAKAAEEKMKALQESKDTLKNLTQSGVWVLVAILIGICLIFASRLFATAIKTVGNGISTIAGSLENLANSLGQKPEAQESSDKDEKSPDDTAAAAAGVAGGSSTTATIEALRSRVVDLNAELLSTINQFNENIVLKYLSNLLSHPDTVDLAVATMEVLGKEKANALFYRLGRTFQDQVVQFLNHGHYRKHKIELMVEGGEQLLTRMMGENFKATRGILTPEVTELLLQLSTSDLADVVNTLEMDHRLRLFFYLEPTRLADVLSVIGKTMPSELEQIGNNLHRIAEFEKRMELDSHLIQGMKQRLEANQQDQMEPYLKYYQEVLETMEESMVEALMNKLAQTDERLKKHLQANIVTFNTYFELPEEFQKELLEGFGNKAVATLIAGVEQKQGEVILKHIEERRHPLIQEEIDSMQAQPKREVRANFDKVKTTLLARMKHLAKSGALSELNQSSPNQPASAAA